MHTCPNCGSHDCTQFSGANFASLHCYSCHTVTRMPYSTKPKLTLIIGGKEKKSA